MQSLQSLRVFDGAHHPARVAKGTKQRTPQAPAQSDTNPARTTPNDANMSSALEAKIVVLGSQGVGKTSLVMRYCKGAFQPSQLTSTVGASFMTKRVVDSDTDTVVRLQIWDTGKSKAPPESSPASRLSHP